MSKNNGIGSEFDADVDLIEKIDKLNEKFFGAMENLKEARPCLQGCDEAFYSVAQKILSAYERLYGLYDEKYRGAIAYETALLKAKNDKTIPFYWRTKWLKKYRQNSAADMVDFESDEYAKEYLEDRQAAIIAQYITCEPPQEPTEGWKFQTVSESAEESPQNAQESVNTAEGGNGGALDKTPVEGKNSASEGVSEGKAEEPKKRRKKGDKENDRESNTVGSVGGATP